jgi:hypothetical protein
MIRWYPPALRAEYGEDMLGDFAENLEGAWERASWRGVARAWVAVSEELTRIVLPWQAARAAPVLLAIVCSLVVYGSMLAAIDPNRSCHK